MLAELNRELHDLTLSPIHSFAEGRAERWTVNRPSNAFRTEYMGLRVTDLAAKLMGQETTLGWNKTASSVSNVV
jgi:hypothetical protein